jgi:hypothetical protein
MDSDMVVATVRMAKLPDTLLDANGAARGRLLLWRGHSLVR